jgi:hypothetical protein
MKIFLNKIITWTIIIKGFCAMENNSNPTKFLQEILYPNDKKIVEADLYYTGIDNNGCLSYIAKKNLEKITKEQIKLNNQYLLDNDDGILKKMEEGNDKIKKVFDNYDKAYQIVEDYRIKKIETGKNYYDHPLKDSLINLGNNQVLNCMKFLKKGIEEDVNQFLNNQQQNIEYDYKNMIKKTINLDTNPYDFKNCNWEVHESNEVNQLNKKHSFCSVTIEIPMVNAISNGYYDKKIHEDLEKSIKILLDKELSEENVNLVTEQNLDLLNEQNLDLVNEQNDNLVDEQNDNLVNEQNVNLSDNNIKINKKKTKDDLYVKNFSHIKLLNEDVLKKTFLVKKIKEINEKLASSSDHKAIENLYNQLEELNEIWKSLN